MSKENTYDNEISPLMAKVIDICKANSIGMVATFDLDDDLCCTSSIPDETGSYQTACVAVPSKRRTDAQACRR